MAYNVYHAKIQHRDLTLDAVIDGKTQDRPRWIPALVSPRRQAQAHFFGFIFTLQSLMAHENRSPWIKGEAGLSQHPVSTPPSRLHQERP